MRPLVFLFAIVSVFPGWPISSLNAQTPPSPANVDNPEAVIRLLVEANANKDLATMKRFMGGDPQSIGYTIDS